MFLWRPAGTLAFSHRRTPAGPQARAQGVRVLCSVAQMPFLRPWWLGSGAPALSRSHPRPIAALVIRRGEDRVGQPAFEIGIVVKLLEELRVILHQPDDHRIERLVEFDPRILLVGIRLRVSVGLICSDLSGDVFGDQLADAITIFPADVAEQIVEVSVVR